MGHARAFYFAYFAAVAALVPFLTLTYASHGLTGPQIGLLTGLMPLVMMLGAPFWTEVADATGRHRSVLAAVLAVSVVVALALSTVTTFAAFALLVALYAFVIAPAIPLVDHAVLDALGGRVSEYGRQRVWGVIGWGLSAPLVGWVTERFGLSWAFYVYVAVMLAALLIAFRVPFAARRGVHPFGGGMMTMLRDPRWLAFLLVVFVGGVALAIVATFVILHLRDLGGSLTLIGTAIALPTVSELPVMFFAGALLKAFGARWLLVLALVGWSLRLVLYAVIPDPVWLLPVQILHGPSFAIMWIAGIALTRQLAPPGAGAAAQGLFTAVVSGLGGLVGGVFGGLTYQWLGAPALFQIMAAITAVGAVGLAISTARSPMAAPTVADAAASGEVT
jgi:MFS transporter, PPP family, 3-phenylpropionic acid transporter